METKRATSSRHKEWRRLAKKERRRRVRRKIARERDADDARLRATLERSANYSNWLAEQEKLDEQREIDEQRERDEKEKLWLEEELRSQREWRVLQERRAKSRQEQILQEEIIRKEFEAKQEALRTKREEKKRRYEEEAKKHEDDMKRLADYIDAGGDTPEFLRFVTESQSGKDPCPFFAKTGACRYGESCSRNHRRIGLTRIILVPNFYNHFCLEKNSAEYDTDVSLEFEGSEMRRHFREFYDEVITELESFGRIETLLYCCNSEIHLRGNLYVEYRSEREAARAWRKLKGRYWAGRQLNCEFVDLKSWRDAVCGMSQCPKGRACNFLHAIGNPYDEYGIKSPPRWAKKKWAQRESTGGSRRSERRSISKWDELDRQSPDESRNWRWSESPEPESNVRTDGEKIRRSTDDRNNRRRGSKSERRRRDESERSSTRSSTTDVDSQKRKISSSRSNRRTDDREIDDGTKYEERSSRRSPKESRKRRRRRDADDNEAIAGRASNSERFESPKIHRGEEKSTNVASKRKLAKEKKESDENFDGNSKESRPSVEKSKIREEEKISKTVKARWDEAETDVDPENDVGPCKRRLATTEEAEISETSTNERKKSGAENITNATSSEREKELQKQSS